MLMNWRFVEGSLTNFSAVSPLSFWAASRFEALSHPSVRLTQRMSVSANRIGFRLTLLTRGARRFANVSANRIDFRLTLLTRGTRRFANVSANRIDFRLTPLTRGAGGFAWVAANRIGFMGVSYDGVGEASGISGGSGHISAIAGKICVTSFLNTSPLKISTMPP